MKIWTLVLPCILVLTVILVTAKEVRAQGEFETDYRVHYIVDPTGQTNVTQDIQLKNKTANYYADMFELKIGSTKVDNVKASDATGPLETQVKFDNNITTISVKFNQKVIGIGKTLDWSLTYTSTELASKSGQIWEVSVPRLAKAGDIGAYLAKVSVPFSFGPVAFSVPTPKTINKVSSTQEFTFDKDQLIQSGISMSFGQKQVFAFKLEYHLENKNLTSQITEITLPPENNYQKVVFGKIDPPPTNVTYDKDRNLIAKYRLTPKTRLDIVAEGYVEVFPQPFRNIDPILTGEDRERYTQPQRYWEADNPLIREKVKELKTPREIYDYVESTLSYSKDRLNQQKIERLGAAKALSNPADAVCMEFTDLFVALARARGIPAREVEGFAYTQNERLRPLSLALAQGDILHAWPEYWDESLGWVQVDPTWGSTSGGLDYFNKLDFNHITFVRRGLSSTNPPPAGAYKREENLGEKTVFVSFAQELPLATFTPRLSLIVPTKIIAGVPLKITAVVENVGSASLIGQRLSLTTTRFDSKALEPIDIDILPPYAKSQFQFRLQTASFFERSTDNLVLSFFDNQVSKPVEIIPIYFVFFSPHILIAALIVILIIVSGYIAYGRFAKQHSKIPDNFQ